jgi:hypothetical protein
MKQSPLKWFTALATAVTVGSATLLSSSLGAASAVAALPVPDMTSNAGFDATCKALRTVQLPDATQMQRLSKQQLQAWVVCKDVALLQQTAQWAYSSFATFNSGGPGGLFSSDVLINAWIQLQLSYMQRELSASRSVLTALKQTPLSKGDALHLRPQTWHLDLDGDGVIAKWEEKFFALPNRNNELAFDIGMPSDSVDVQANALIKTDASDVLWALSYHEFIEGIVAMLQAHRLNFNNPGADSGLLTLTDKASWTRAHGLIAQGMATSLALRESVLAETDNDYEWIPNPKQSNSAFPLLLEQADFDTWGQMLTEAQALWTGKTVLTPSEFGRGLLGDSARICKDGNGLDIPKLFTTHPPTSMIQVSEFNNACSPLSAERTASKLPDMAQQRMNHKTPGGKMMRYLYWVN